MKKLKPFFHKVKSLFLSPEVYARTIGVKIGTNCLIADKRHWSSEPYLITIGDNTQITEGVTIHTHGGGNIVRRICPDFDSFGKVNIGNRVYIGAYSHIMPGVTIEDNVLVAAGSVVTKSVPSGYVVGGNPAKIICSVDTFIERNLRYNTETKGKSREYKKQVLATLSEDKFIKKEFLRIPEDK